MAAELMRTAPETTLPLKHHSRQKRGRWYRACSSRGKNSERRRGVYLIRQAGARATQDAQLGSRHTDFYSSGFGERIHPCHHQGGAALCSRPQLQRCSRLPHPAPDQPEDRYGEEDRCDTCSDNRHVARPSRDPIAPAERFIRPARQAEGAASSSPHLRRAATGS